MDGWRSGQQWGVYEYKDWAELGDLGKYRGTSSN